MWGITFLVIPVALVAPTNKRQEFASVKVSCNNQVVRRDVLFILGVETVLFVLKKNQYFSIFICAVVLPVCENVKM